MPLPRLVARFADAGCFNLDEAQQWYGRPRPALLGMIADLKQAGYIHRIRRGIYGVTSTRSGTPIVDPLVVAAKITRPYLLGHHAALEAHGLAYAAAFNTVTVSTPQSFAVFTFEGVTYRPATIDPWFIEHHATHLKRRGEDIVVATPELALVQCAERPHLAGGLSEVTESLSGLPHLDWQRLLSILERRDRLATYRKVGWLVAQHAHAWHPPDDWIKAVQQHLGHGITYFGTRPHSPLRIDPTWQVAVPRTYGEESMDAF